MRLCRLRRPRLRRWSCPVRCLWWLGDVQILHTRLSESAREIAALKTEVATLYDTSPSADAMTYRISKLLQTAVDEVSQMQTEVQTQAAARVAAAKSEAEKLLSDAEIIADTLATDARANAEKLLSTAKINATRQIRQAQSMTEELAEQQISILEQLMAVYRTLDGVPAFLASAYRDRGNPATPPAHPASAPTATNTRCVYAHTRPTSYTNESGPNHRPGDQPVHHQPTPR